MWDENPALVLLAPLLFLDGLYARYATVKLPEAAGPRSGSAGAGPAVRILIVGDSAAAGVGVDRQERALAGQLVQALQEKFLVRWKLIAVTGATTESALRDFASYPAEAFDVALTSLGVNDVTSGLSVSEWLRQQKQLIELLQTRFHVRYVLVSALPPMHKFFALPEPLRWFFGRRAMKFTAALRELVHTKSGCALVELGDITQPGMIAVDGFHPSAQTYAAWGQAAAAMIAERSAASASLSVNKP